MKVSEISFLEASKLIKNVQGLPAKNIRIKSSVSLHQLHLYLKAFGAKSGLDLNVEEIEFGTLRQSLYQEDNDAKDIFILFPWDFLGSLDWRTGISSKSVNVSSALREIDDFFDQLNPIKRVSLPKERKNIAIFFASINFKYFAGNLKYLFLEFVKKNYECYFLTTFQEIYNLLKSKGLPVIKYDPKDLSLEDFNTIISSKYMFLDHDFDFARVDKNLFFKCKPFEKPSLL